MPLLILCESEHMSFIKHITIHSLFNNNSNNREEKSIRLVFEEIRQREKKKIDEKTQFISYLPDYWSDPLKLLLHFDFLISGACVYFMSRFIFPFGEIYFMIV